MKIERIGKLRVAALLCAAILAGAFDAAAQAPIISLSPGDTINTVAGTGVKGFSGDGGAALSAAMANPFSMAADAAGNVYIADRDNHRVRRIDTSGNIATVAGNGEQGFFGDGGPATSASLNTPTAVAVDTNGNIYIADSNNHRIRVVATATSTPSRATALPGIPAMVAQPRAQHSSRRAPWRWMPTAWSTSRIRTTTWFAK